MLKIKYEDKNILNNKNNEKMLIRKLEKELKKLELENNMEQLLSLFNKGAKRKEMIMAQPFQEEYPRPNNSQQIQYPLPNFNRFVQDTQNIYQNLQYYHPQCCANFFDQTPNQQSKEIFN